MCFKVIKDEKVIDLLENPTYIKYQKKHDLMLLCPESEAEGIVSSDQKYFWHVNVFPAMEKQNIDTVELVEIDQYEYNQLKALNGRSVQEILDFYTLSLLEGGII